MSTSSVSTTIEHTTKKGKKTDIATSLFTFLYYQLAKYPPKKNEKNIDIIITANHYMEPKSHFIILLNNSQGDVNV